MGQSQQHKTIWTLRKHDDLIDTIRLQGQWLGKSERLMMVIMMVMKSTQKGQG